MKIIFIFNSSTKVSLSFAFLLSSLLGAIKTLKNSSVERQKEMFRKPIEGESGTGCKSFATSSHCCKLPHNVNGFPLLEVGCKAGANLTIFRLLHIALTVLVCNFCNVK